MREKRLPALNIVLMQLPALASLISVSRMKDRDFDMPYIMLRGPNYFVTYGWSLNNVCKVGQLQSVHVA